MINLSKFHLSGLINRMLVLLQKVRTVAYRALLSRSHKTTQTAPFEHNDPRVCVPHSREPVEIYRRILERGQPYVVKQLLPLLKRVSSSSSFSFAFCLQFHFEVVLVKTNDSRSVVDGAAAVPVVD